MQVTSLLAPIIAVLSRLAPALIGAMRTTMSTPSAIAFILLVLVVVPTASTVVTRPSRRSVLAAAGLLLWPVVLIATLAGVLLPLIAATAVAGVATTIGLAIGSRAEMNELDGLEHFTIAFALGLGAVGLILLGLATGGLLVVPALVLVGVVSLVASGATVMRHGLPRRAAAALTRTAPIGIALTALCVLLIEALAVYVVAPEVNYDSTYYHLTLARDFVALAGAPSLPELWTSDTPILAQLVYAAVTALSSLDGAKIVHFVIGLGCVASVAAIAARVRGPLAGGLAALLWLATPLVLWEMASAYADLFLVFWALTALLAALVWADTGRPVYALVAGACIGFGLGVKITMAFVAIGLVAGLLLVCVRRRRDLVTWLAAAGVAAAVAAPWYVRSYALTGNPVFPLYNALFRSPLWEPENTSFNFGGFGMGNGPLDFLLLPWRLSVSTSRFVEGPDGALGLLPLLVGAGVALALWRRERRELLVAAFTVGGLAAWFVTAEYARYALPLLGTGAALAATTLVGFLQAPGTALRIGSRGAVLALGLLGFPALVGMMWNVPGGVPWAVDLGVTARPAYLREALRQYRAYEWIDRNIDDAATSRFLGVGLSEWSIAYGPPHVFIGHQTLDGTRVLVGKSDDEVLRGLAKGEFRYVIIDEFPRPSPAKTSWLIASDAFIARHLRLLYANNYVYVYALGAPDPTRSAEVLRDPHFATIGSAASPWVGFGTAADAPTACRGLTMTTSGGVQQTFTASENTLYTVELQVEPLVTDLAYAKLQVSWSATGGESFTNIEIAPLTRGSSLYRMSSTSPVGATSGIVSVSGYGSEAVCVTAASILQQAPAQ